MMMLQPNLFTASITLQWGVDGKCAIILCDTELPHYQKNYLDAVPTNFFMNVIPIAAAVIPPILLMARYDNALLV